MKCFTPSCQQLSFSLFYGNFNNHKGLIIYHNDYKKNQVIKKSTLFALTVYY